MLTIRQNYSLKKYDGDVGIEIEVEGKGLQPPPPLWAAIHDGSLRGESIEYVTKTPVFREAIDSRLQGLSKCLEDGGAEVFNSLRAGVHVHVNVQELTHTQTITFATAYYLLEEVLLAECGDGREGNSFCMNVSDADGVLRAVDLSVRGGDFKGLNSDGIRYSSLNWKPVTMYGSLEFRGLGTPKDFGKIGVWAKILLSILDYSLQYEHPSDIIQQFSYMRTEELLKRCLGQFAEPYLRNKNFEGLMFRGMRNAQDLAFMTDWVNFEGKLQSKYEDRLRQIKQYEGQLEEDDEEHRIF